MAFLCFGIFYFQYKKEKKMAQKTLSKKPFGIADKLGYMFGDFGNDFTFMLSSSFMMAYYTTVIGIEGAIVGLLMMAARFVDAVTDVTMGQIVDRSKPTKDGKFKPWIRRCCIPLAISAFLLFFAPVQNWPKTIQIVWMFVTYILWGSIFYTSVNIPYGSMASAITADPDERSQLSTYRSMGASLAQLVIGIGTPLIAYVTNAEGQSVLEGTRMMLIAGVYAICGCLCHMLCFSLCTERIEVPQNTSKLQVGKMLKSLVTNRALLGIILAAICLLLGMLGMSGMAPYMFPYYYGSAAYQSINTAVFCILSMFICGPLAAKFAKKWGKKEVSIAGSLLCALIWIVCMIVRPQSAFAFVAFYSLSYAALGFFNYNVWAMITDVIDAAEVKNGHRDDGTIYSVYSFARKIGQALSSGFIGVFISAIGFNAEVSNNLAAYPDVREGLMNISCLIPAIGMVIVALVLAFVYPLNKKRVDSNAAELKRRRESKA